MAFRLWGGHWGAMGFLSLLWRKNPSSHFLTVWMFCMGKQSLHPNLLNARLGSAFDRGCFGEAVPPSTFLGSLGRGFELESPKTPVVQAIPGVSVKKPFAGLGGGGGRTRGFPNFLKPSLDPKMFQGDLQVSGAGIAGCLHAMYTPVHSHGNYHHSPPPIPQCKNFTFVS